MKTTISWFLFLFLVFCCLPAFSNQSKGIKDNDAIRAIIGEASDQGYQGMLAVAVGIRNRGTLKGVYGLNAVHVDNESDWVWELAEKAWRESVDNKLHIGTHWENVKEFGEPDWGEKMEEVYEYKDHKFYIEIRKVK